MRFIRKLLVSLFACILAILFMVLSGLMDIGWMHLLQYAPSISWMQHYLMGLSEIIVVYVLCRRVSHSCFHLTSGSLGITKPRSLAHWLLCSVLLPLGVITFYLALVPGKLELPGELNTDQIIRWIGYTVFFVGLSPGIIEELVFRGMLFGTLKRLWGLKTAVLLPSVLFSLIHLLKVDFHDPLAVMLLLFGGTTVGVMFSMIRIQSESIWSGAFVHGVWNATFSIIAIGSTLTDNTIIKYVLNSHNPLLESGDMGIEVGLPAILFYAAVAGYACILCFREKRRFQEG